MNDHEEEPKEKKSKRLHIAVPSSLVDRVEDFRRETGERSTAEIWRRAMEQYLDRQEWKEVGDDEAIEYDPEFGSTSL